MSKTDLRKFIRGVLSESLQVIDKDDQDSPTFITYYMPLEEDRFIHFTSEVRANQILETGKLLMSPPHEKFGTDTVDAVSVMWGTFVPEVQTNHVLKTSSEKGEGTVVGIVFETDSLPKYGYPEEVKWGRDVTLIRPQIVSLEDGKAMLQNTPYHPEETEDFIVKYSK